MTTLTSSDIAIDLPDDTTSSSAICIEQLAELIEDHELWLEGEPLRIWYPRGAVSQRNANVEIIFIQEETLSNSANKFAIVDTARTPEQVLNDVFTNRERLTFREALVVQRLIRERLKEEIDREKLESARYWKFDSVDET